MLSLFLLFLCLLEFYATWQIYKDGESWKALYKILSTVMMTRESLGACRLGPRFEEAVPLRAGENVLESEEGVKVVVEKTFWQKYVSFLVRPFASILGTSLIWLNQ